MTSVMAVGAASRRATRWCMARYTVPARLRAGMLCGTEVLNSEIEGTPLAVA